MKTLPTSAFALLLFTASTLSAIADTTIISTPFGPVEVPNDPPIRPGLYGPTDEPLDLAAFEQLALERQPALAQSLQQDELASRSRVEAYMLQEGVGDTMVLDDGREALLIDVVDGQPTYLATHNIDASRSISADHVWAPDGGVPMGDMGLSLSGDGVLLGIWDGGDVDPVHPEFDVVSGFARVSDGDGFSISNVIDTNHANHVAGTMAASGTRPQARGVAWNADVRSWFFSSIFTKMRNAVDVSAGSGPDGSALPPLRLSNNSYGPPNLGWGAARVRGAGTVWAWNADPTVYQPGEPILEDYRYGYYTAVSQSLDDLIYASPRYLPVYSAGNERDIRFNSWNSVIYRTRPDGVDALDESKKDEVAPEENPPWLWFVINDGSRYVAVQRSIAPPFDFALPPPVDGDENGNFVFDEDGDGESDLFDTLGEWAVAKNNLTVASIEDLPNGWVPGTGFSHVSVFSSFGPTDDGRVKPDLSANGDQVYSSTADAYPQDPIDPDPDYHTLDGTSMAAPGVTGGLGLILELWRAQGVNGRDPLGSTLKALAINSVDELGPDLGPDYRSGWGVFNVARAAETLRYNAFTRTGGAETQGIDSSGRFVRELALMPGESWQTEVVSRGLIWDDNLQRIRATAVWTDAPGVILPRAVDNRTPMLVNDLDLKIILPGVDGVLGTIDDVDVYPWRLDPDNPAAAATRGENTVDNVEQIDALNVQPGTRVRIVLTRKSGGTPGVQPVSLVVSGAMPPARATSMVFLPDNRADIGWPSIAGRSYRIESSATLDPANWTPVSTVTATESFTIANIVMPDVETFFWRVVEL